MTDKDITADRVENTIAVLGAGNIGTAVARALAGSGRVVLWNRSRARLDAFGEVENISKTTELAEALAAATRIFICVESPAVPSLIAQFGQIISGRDVEVVSCAASQSLEALESALKPYVETPKVARLLPNIAATVGASVNLFCSAGIDEDHKAELVELCSSLGPVVSIPESLFGAGMALSSCGIAYAARYIRACMSAGVEMGLSAIQAKELAIHAVAGTAALLAAGGEHPEILVDKVCTPGGVTVAGLNKMEECGLTDAVIKGLKAAARKV